MSVLGEQARLLEVRALQTSRFEQCQQDSGAVEEPETLQLNLA